MELPTASQIVGHDQPVGVAISRASWFAEGFWGVPTIQVPVVGGRTVWQTADIAVDWLRILEQPNYFGRFEQDLPLAGETVTVERWRGAGALGSIVEIEMQLASDASRVARRLAGRLRQIRGVKLPHGRPETPWLVVSLPFDASTASARLLEEGFEGCDPLGDTYPEFPGGMRIQVAWPEKDNERFARVIETTLEA